MDGIALAQMPLPEPESCQRAPGSPMLSGVTEEADNQLMTRYRDGDLAAFETLYHRHKTRLYRFLLAQLRQPELCDDCFQEVWGRIIRARGRYEARAKFTTYLFTVARNIVVDHYRWRHRQPALEPGDWETMPGDQRGPAMHYAAAETGGALKDALETLPAEQRDVFLLHEEAGLTLNEIATVMGTSRETIKSRLRYGVRKLRAALEEETTE